jgi:soluble lytic murein transglycosylase-like protein
MDMSNFSYKWLRPGFLLAPFGLAGILLLSALFVFVVSCSSPVQSSHDFVDGFTYDYSQLSYDAQAGIFLNQGHSPWLGSLQERQERAWPLVRHFSERENLDPALVMALVQVESHFDPRVVSGRGARGLMQINGVTARHLGLEDPMDPVANLEAGTRYLATLGKIFNNDVQLMLAAYNAGPSRVQAAGGAVPKIKETQEFVNKVLSQSEYFRNRFQ